VELRIYEKVGHAFLNGFTAVRPRSAQPSPLRPGRTRSELCFSAAFVWRCNGSVLLPHMPSRVTV